MRLTKQEVYEKYFYIWLYQKLVTDNPKDTVRLFAGGTECNTIMNLLSNPYDETGTKSYDVNWEFTCNNFLGIDPHKEDERVSLYESIVQQAVEYYNLVVATNINNTTFYYTQE